MKCCAVAFSISVLAALSLGEFACVKPAGVDDGTPGALSSTELSLPSGSADDSIFIPLATITIPYLLGLETPIQFHHTTSFGMVLFNLLALYEEKAIDALGHKELWDSRRFCRPDTTSTDAFILHRRAAYAYAILFITRVMNAKNKPVIEATEKLCGLWGLDLSKCSRESDCDSNDTPWGLAHTLVEEMKTWMANDGWNLDGSLSREYNKRPYSDWREKPYSPSNAPWNVTDVTRWTPLLEDNGNGFAFHQVHVTPHIGEAGKSLYLRDEEFCRRQLPDPQYDLEKELFLNLQRSAALNDERKVELEFFDQKLLSLFPIAIEYFQRMGISVDSFEFWSWEMVLNAGYYDSTLLSWREKIRTGLARPTSVAMFLGAGKTARAYAGGEMGVQDVPVDQWEPYIRTMPHAEYPSASSCFCVVFEEVMAMHSGGDDFSALIDGPIVREFAAGSSAHYAGMEPSHNVTLSYKTWSEMAAVCGQSRLNGGMHFRAAVPAGRSLCSGIGEISFKAVTNLKSGIVPEYISSFDCPPEKEFRC